MVEIEWIDDRPKADLTENPVSIAIREKLKWTITHRFAELLELTPWYEWYGTVVILLLDRENFEVLKGPKPEWAKEEPQDNNNNPDALGLYYSFYPPQKRNVIVLCPEKIYAASRSQKLAVSGVADPYETLFCKVAMHELAHALMDEGKINAHYSIKQSFKAKFEFIEESLANALALEQSYTTGERDALKEWVRGSPPPYRACCCWEKQLSIIYDWALSWRRFKSEFARLPELGEFHYYRIFSRWCSHCRWPFQKLAHVLKQEETIPLSVKIEIMDPWRSLVTHSLKVPPTLEQEQRKLLSSAVIGAAIKAIRVIAADYRILKCCNYSPPGWGKSEINRLRADLGTHSNDLSRVAISWKRYFRYYIDDDYDSDDLYYLTCLENNLETLLQIQ